MRKPSRSVSPRPPRTADAGRAREAVARCRALIREKGEASSAVAARDTLAAYLALGDAARARFFDALAREFSPTPAAVIGAARAYADDPSPAHLERLQEVAEPVRQELFRRLNMAPGGTAALVAMRLAVLNGLDSHPAWRVIDADLKHLLRSWFNRGFLSLQRIDWRTSAIVLEKLIAYEAVHRIQGWDDLRRRLQADRRCFAFFHPQLPDDPLIFIEVALTRSISARVQPLLDINSPVEDPAGAGCAIFYSITHCQQGLRGISFGNFLIKQVAQDLRAELPRVRRFSTLSPIPGLRSWLLAQRERLPGGENGDALRSLIDRLRDAAALQPADEALLMPLAAYYLTQVRRDDEPLDPVARFHLGNGAVMARLNWMGDTSAQGGSRSFGVMANYVYRLNEVERNHEIYVNEHRVIALPAVQQLAEIGAALFAGSPASRARADA